MNRVNEMPNSIQISKEGSVNQIWNYVSTTD